MAKSRVATKAARQQTSNIRISDRKKNCKCKRQVAAHPELVTDGAASLLAEVEGALADMNKREKFALEALERYQNSPTVNAETAQPDPGGE